MSKKKKIKIIVMIAAVITAIITIVRKFEKKAKDTSYKAKEMDSIPSRRMGIYEKYIKRIMDIICSLAAIICFCWLYIVVAILVKVKLGSPVLFTQERPGLIGEDGKETIFKMYKFRTMTDERDENGELLPDEVRLTRFGKWLRSTSLDELPEAFNILNGTMSVVGPRPQLVRDMVFMTSEQRMRHTAKPGLSGLAQINGRNDIDWEDKLEWDLKYINHIGFLGDIKIIIKTIEKAFVKKEGITEGDMATAEDFGDYLLKNEKVSRGMYQEKQKIANNIVNKMRESHSIIDEEVKNISDDAVKNIKYSVLMSLYIKEKPEYLKLAIESMINQTLKPDEIVIVKDGRVTSELQEILDNYLVSYPNLFNIIGYEKNRGLGLALNYGISHCKNELIARMDTDDIAKTDRCMKQVKAFFLHPEYCIVGASVDEFYGTIDNITGRRVVPSQAKEIYEFAKRRSAFNHPAVMYRKSAVLKFKGYANLRRNQDVDLFGRMLYGGCKATNFEESLLWFRSDENLAKRRKSWENTWSYIDAIRKFWRVGYSSFFDFIVIVGAQIVMYLMPISVQNWIYKIFLRK